MRAIGPGLLVTVGFIDPGNWASNMAAGSQFGYSLLWVVTLSTIMLIVLQHNAAHLGIVTGECLAESVTRHMPRFLSRFVLLTALAASVATAMAEILGGAIALQMLLGLPLRAGAVVVAAVSLVMLLTNSYMRVERWIIGFVSLIGLSFLFEIALVHVDWASAAAGWVAPTVPVGSPAIIVSVLGAVVMPHNLFLHSEIIQSQCINERGDDAIAKRLRSEFVDTLFSMVVGWAINSAMVLLAASVFWNAGTLVTDLAQAACTLEPILGAASSTVFRSRCSLRVCLRPSLPVWQRGPSLQVLQVSPTMCATGTARLALCARFCWRPLRYSSSKTPSRGLCGARCFCLCSCLSQFLSRYGLRAPRALWESTQTAPH